MGRQIIYAREFDAGAEALGGYSLIDPALDAVIEALYRNPYAFHKFENDFISFRYAITNPFQDVPSLIIIFSIAENGDVTLERVEENPG